MKIIKRNGTEAQFDSIKITNAISRANKEVSESNRLSDKEIDTLSLDIKNKCEEMNRSLNVEEIQNLVEDELMGHNTLVARKYITYRYNRALIRKSNTTDDQILSLIECNNEEIKQENSNKNPVINSVQRDYIAGEVSKDLTRRILLPSDIIKAHEEGIIHFHDSDYFSQHIHNCCLVDLDDMLQNGTVISETMIEKPKSFSTACNIATQIIAQVASSQYGGQSISLSHLAPFVDISRQKIRKQVKEEFNEINKDITEEEINKIAELRLNEEVKRGVQTIQYQVVTLMTTNGQAPFITVFMYLNETEGQTKKDLALIIEETLKQRMIGVKNEKGVYVTPAFPKLIYVLQEDNIEENSEFYYLTELAAKCTSKRLVPDYISEKIMKELKVDNNNESHCYPSMGCVDGQEVITYKIGGFLYVESFERMWNRIIYWVNKDQGQNGKDDLNRVVLLENANVYIYDTLNGFVKVKYLIRNIQNNWCDVAMSNGRRLKCTSDHPFHTSRGRVYAKDLCETDEVIINTSQYSENRITVSNEEAYLLGFMLCDRSYSAGISSSIAAHDEDDIRDEDVNKINRHIPNEVFSYYPEQRLEFLAGMIDADGHINKSSNVQISSTNKELAIQQMLLAQSLGMPSKLYYNNDSADDSKIRYRIEFYPTEQLISKLACQKKTNNYTKGIISSISNISIIRSVTHINETQYSYDVTTESDHFEVSGIFSHNCRSFLTPYINEQGNPQYYGRFNQGVVTLNLVDIACSSNKDIKEFWNIMDERLDLCKKALMCRHKRLLGTSSDVAPILWQHGAIARLNKGETIDKLLFNGYSTISLGYAGLYECVKYMTGKSHTDQSTTPFAIQIMQYLNDKCTEWKKEENIDFSLYGSPIESTTYKFAKSLQKRFGIIKGVTDRNYITNSYHVHVTEEIDAFEKLLFESQFQRLSPGGAISYVEVPNMQDNIEAVLAIMKHIYNHIMYAELNTKSDYCMLCGFDGEIEIKEDSDGKLIWVCPNCGNHDQNKMSVTRRTCGLTI